MTEWTSLKYVVVDVEGNGQRPPDLVELAAIPIAEGKIGTPQSWLVRPEEPITDFVRRIHGISNEDVAEAPVFADIQDEVLAALDGAVLVGHNAHVDVGVLQRKLGEWECPEVFDTLKLSRRLRPELKSYKLGSLVDTFCLDVDLPPALTPHRATYDALVAARLFIKLITQTYRKPLTLEELREPPSGGDTGDETSTLF